MSEITYAKGQQMKSGETRADANRRVRREALRDKLEAMGLIQQVVETTKKLSDLDEILDSIAVQRLRAANESRFKLINKYLPDARDDQNVNLGTQPGDPLEQLLIIANGTGLKPKSE